MMSNVTCLTPCPWTPLQGRASHLWVLICKSALLHQRASPKLSPTGLRGLPQGAAGVGEGGFFGLKLSRALEDI